MRNNNLNKQWIIQSKKSDDIVEQILINRNIDKSKWEKFLKPNFEHDLHDPFKLPDMKLAVKRIMKAIEKKETIGIFGDYDADGIPATALLSESLEKYLKLKTIVYIPTRKEGYGLNKQGIEYLKNEGATILITVDLGIREIDNINFAKKIGLDVIVTDHHEPGEKLPDALAIINPKRRDSKYPFRELSGGGVVFKFLHALSQECKKISSNDLKWMLDLVGITTICDMVPLIDENRIFAKYGLIVLQKTKRIGLKKLYEKSAIKPEDISVYTIGFQIGPRINAPGRMDHTNESFELLRSLNEKRADELAERLNLINRERQDELERILQEARKKIYKEKLNQNKIIIVMGENWPSGLVGLVAGRITEEFARPSFIFEKQEKVCKGSARSIEGFNLVEALEETKDILDNFGGHTKAAGMTLDCKKMKLFSERLLCLANIKLKDEDLLPKLYIDKELKIQDLHLSLYDKIKKLEPYGLANPRPVFMMKNVCPTDGRQLGKDNKHLRFHINQFKAIAFDCGDRIKEIQNNKIDIAFTLDEDTWGGDRKLELKIVDIKINK